MDFLPDNDARWSELKGGYKVLYNPLPLLQRLAKSPLDTSCWEEVWLNLHHQGDVDTASYVTAVYLMRLREQGIDFDWNLYAFIATVEVQRHKVFNPPIPYWLAEDYKKAWASISAFCVEDMKLVEGADGFRVYLSVLALAKGLIDLGDLLITIDDDQISGFIAGEMGWE